MRKILRIPHAQVRQAELNALQARSGISNADLVAPAKGIISQVNIRQGELSGGQLAAMVLTNVDQFHMTVLVDEIDVRQVAVGQLARISVDALPDRDLTGRVTEIAPSCQRCGRRDCL